MRVGLIPGQVNQQLTRYQRLNRVHCTPFFRNTLGIIILRTTTLHPMKAINLHQKFGLFEDQWSPKIIAQLNGQDVKLAKIEGSFVWHAHEEQDELFHVIRGRMTMEFRDQSVEVEPGEIIVVPRGVEHRPVAQEEVWILLFEPHDTAHTGGVEDPRAVDHFPHI